MNLGTDILLIDDYRLSAIGDLQLIDKIQNIRESIYRRIITNPGELPHRPNYGVGIYRYMNKPSTAANRQELANAIKRNIIQDNRIKEIKNISCDWIDNTAQIYLNINVYGNYVEFEYGVIRL